MQESFFGKFLLHLTVFAILLIRSTDDIAKYKNLFDEATFYDKQWNATWEGQARSPVTFLTECRSLCWSAAVSASCNDS